MRVRREVIRDGVLDDAKELLGSLYATDTELVQELDHETAEALEGSRDTDVRVDFDEDSLGGVDVHLEKTSLVEGRV